MLEWVDNDIPIAISMIKKTTLANVKTGHTNMTIFHFLTSVSWKGRPQLLSVDTSPAVGTSVMASEPLCETSPMVRLLAGTSHCANLARKQIDLCQLELFSTCSPSSRSSRQTGQVASSPLFTLLLTTQPSTWGENCLIWKTTNTNTKINKKKI